MRRYACWWKESKRKKEMKDEEFNFRNYYIYIYIYIYKYVCVCVCAYVFISSEAGKRSEEGSHCSSTHSDAGLMRWESRGRLNASRSASD
jgi:hypothetical protein